MVEWLSSSLEEQGVGEGVGVLGGGGGGVRFRSRHLDFKDWVSPASNKLRYN